MQYFHNIYAPTLKVETQMSSLHCFWNLHDHLLNEFAFQAPRHENEDRPNSRYLQVVILADLHVVSRDFSW